MKCFRILAAALLATALPAAAQSSLPYYSGFDSPAELAGWTTFRKASTTAAGWDFVSGYSAPKCLVHFYPVASSAPTVDWYVSPAFNLAAGGKLDSLRVNFSGFSMPVTTDTISLYLLTGSQDPDQATSIISLYDFKTIYNNDGKWRLVSNIGIPPGQSGQSYLAFKYATTSSWLDVKFDNILVRANSGAGLRDEWTEAQSIAIFPNPASDFIMFKTTNREFANESLTLKLYNALGERIVTKKVSFDDKVALNLADGIYLYELVYSENQLLKCGRIFVKSD